VHDDLDTGPLLDGMVQLAFEVTGALSRIAAAHDLSLTQLRLLAILRDRTPTMGGLATFLGLDRSSVSGLVDRAVERGLVERMPDERDRRSTRVALAPAGASLAAVGAREIAGALRPATAAFGGEDGERFAAMLARAVGLLHPASEPR